MKDEPKMYSTKEGDPVEYKYTRGFARRLGVSAASGSLITYMDSDDYLKPEFTMTHMLIYNQFPNVDWWINQSWYDNHEAEWEESDIMHPHSESEEVEFPYLQSKWKATKLKENRIVMSPWLFSHKPGITVLWRDVYGTKSEDVDFNQRVREAYPNGRGYSNPIYIRCHYSKRWDV